MDWENPLALIAQLEVARRRIARVQSRAFAEMDTDWLRQRLPQLCLVDELAHTNHPGGGNAKRWQDVEELLDAGIDGVDVHIIADRGGRSDGPQR